jgi:hypothetical protein
MKMEKTSFMLMIEKLPSKTYLRQQYFARVIKKIKIQAYGVCGLRMN